MQKKINLIVASCLFAFLSCAKPTASLEFIRNNQSVSPKIRLLVAETENKRRLGLMYRKELPENEGMLFIFPNAKAQSFWMKNTYIPLDMLFLNSNLEPVCIFEHASPLSEQSLTCDTPCLYVLEINAGLVKKWGLTSEAKALINGTLPQAK